MADNNRGMSFPSITTQRYGIRPSGAWPVSVYNDRGVRIRIGYAPTREAAAAARAQYYAEREQYHLNRD